MDGYDRLRNFFANQKYRLVIASDAETRVHKVKNGKIQEIVPAGGVAIALDPIARAAGATYIGRGKTPEEKQVLDAKGKIRLTGTLGEYDLRRIFISEPDFNDYYYGFSNQTLWPLCHVAFERPEFKKDWFEGFKRVNQVFAKAIKEEIKGKTFVWVNDYQLSFVPSYLGKQKDVVVALFWHIPWPTWEVFRILPQKKELLESMLQCDLIAFHRGYHVRNFLETVERELEVRVDQETNKIFYKNHVTTVANLPMGIDADVIKSLAVKRYKQPFLTQLVGSLLPDSAAARPETAKEENIAAIFKKYRVILGVDRLDYTKGLMLRLRALDLFLEKNKGYLEKVVYVGVIAPSREQIVLYQNLKKEVREAAARINAKYARGNWRPIELFYEVFSREDVITFYENADLCLVTPRDDGMNLVSKEFVLASSLMENPGMLVLSQFAGSAIDLTESLIVNPYNTEELAEAIKKGLEMPMSEKKRRIKRMAETLEEKNVYEWAQDFVRQGIAAAK